MKFDLRYPALLAMMMFQVKAFCGPEFVRTKTLQNDVRQEMTPSFDPPCRQRGRGRSYTKLHYVPKRQKEEDSGTDLFFAPSTDPNFEKVNVDHSFRTVNGIIIKRYKELIEVDDEVTENVETKDQEQKLDNTWNVKEKMEGIFESFESTFGNEKRIPLDHHKAVDDLPTAIAYAATLSVAGIASGLSIASKTIAVGFEEASNMSREIEGVFAEIATDIRDSISNEDIPKQNFFNNIGEKFRKGSKSSSDDDLSNPLPELEQAKQNYFNNIGETFRKGSKKQLGGFSAEDDFSHPLQEQKYFNNIGETFRKGSKKQLSGSSAEDDFSHPLPEQKYFNNIGEKFRKSSKKQPSGSSSSDDDVNNPLPELAQALVNQVERVHLSSPLKKKKKKIANVPPPPKGGFYSPFEVCNILYWHEMDPILSKPKAMQDMIDEKYVPVGKSSLYRIFKQFKEGKITEGREWGKRSKLIN